MPIPHNHIFPRWFPLLGDGPWLSSMQKTPEALTYVAMEARCGWAIRAVCLEIWMLIPPQWAERQPGE